MELLLILIFIVLFIRPIIIAITTVFSMFIYSFLPAMLILFFLFIIWSFSWAVFSFIPQFILVVIVLYVIFKLFDK